MEARAVWPRVAIRYFDGCPNWRTTYQRVNEVLAALGFQDAKVALERVETAEDAERLRFIGSPTILFEGEDPFAADTDAGYGLSCRVFSTPEGPAGSPTKEQLAEVLAARLGGHTTS